MNKALVVLDGSLMDSSERIHAILYVQSKGVASGTHRGAKAEVLRTVALPPIPVEIASADQLMLVQRAHAS